MIGVTLMKKIFVVIPNWNGVDIIADCLKSLDKQTHKHHVVVVDNGSVDKSVSVIRAKFPAVHLINLPDNTGFSGGVNTGIRYALQQGAEAIALFNNDAVADKNWLKELVKTMRSSPKAGIITGKFMRSDKIHFDSTGDYYSIWGMPLPRGRNLVDTGQYNVPEEVFGATGGASLYRTALFKQIGLFDEAFFAYYEDVDLSFRAQLSGWKILYNPKAITYHEVGGTSSKLGSFTRYHATKNFFMLYAKNMPGWVYWKYLPLFTLQAARLGASSLLRGGGWPYIQGVSRAFLNTPHIIRERRNIQKHRKVSIKYIDSLLYKHRPPRIPKLS